VQQLSAAPLEDAIEVAQEQENQDIATQFLALQAANQPIPEHIKEKIVSAAIAAGIICPPPPKAESDDDESYYDDDDESYDDDVAESYDAKREVC
jgi:hypothetical protein